MQAIDNFKALGKENEEQAAAKTAARKEKAAQTKAARQAAIANGARRRSKRGGPQVDYCENNQDAGQDCISMAEASQPAASTSLIDSPQSSSG